MKKKILVFLLLLLIWPCASALVEKCTEHGQTFGGYTDPDRNGHIKHGAECYTEAHLYGTAEPKGDGYHKRTCVCSWETTFPCVDDAKDHKCDECGGKVGTHAASAGTHNCNYCNQKVTDCSGGNATCTGKPVCTICGKEYGEPLGHDKVNHPAKAPTCTEAGWTAYVTCKRCAYSSYQELPATGHAYAAQVTAPTCGKAGYTTYTCRYCGDSYKADETPARAHWYGLWTYNGNDAHSANCRRCAKTQTAPCAQGYEVAVGAETWKVCLVCGRMGNLQLAAQDAATAKALDKNALPQRGELIVRGVAAPFDGALYALTAGYEYAGRMEPFGGRVAIAVPLALEAPFHVERLDTAGRTEIPFQYENGVLTLETDKDGVLLLVAGE